MRLQAVLIMAIFSQLCDALAGEKIVQISVWDRSLPYASSFKGCVAQNGAPQQKSSCIKDVGAARESLSVPQVPEMD